MAASMLGVSPAVSTASSVDSLAAATPHVVQHSFGQELPAVVVKQKQVEQKQRSVRREPGMHSTRSGHRKEAGNN